jgi:ABC-type dipeptide/oligopeptide/nickel transport system permease subunit
VTSLPGRSCPQAVNRRANYLGLTDPRVPSWGSLLNVTQNYLDTVWWMSIFLGAAICLAVLAFNLFADGLSEFLNPRRSGKRASWSLP